MDNHARHSAESYRIHHGDPAGDLLADLMASVGTGTPGADFLDQHDAPCERRIPDRGLSHTLRVLDSLLDTPAGRKWYRDGAEAAGVKFSN